MEASNEHATPKADTHSPQSTTVCSLSPDQGPSSDSELSFYLGNLHCQEGPTPRRRLQLTPELLTPSPIQNREVSNEMTTPTDEIKDKSESGKRKSVRSVLQRCSAPKMRQNSGKVQGTNEDKDRKANKENKRLRVKLSSRFAGSTALQGPARRGRGQSWSPEDSRDPGEVRWTELAALLPGQWTKSNHRPHTFDIPDYAVEDRNLIGDYSKPYPTANTNVARGGPADLLKRPAPSTETFKSANKTQASCCQPHLLPVERGEHQDLQCISAQTVASLLKGKYRSAVESYVIIDCRYPYEYQGGHIKEAVNFHSEAQLQEALFQDTVTSQMSPRTRSPSSPPTTAFPLDRCSPTQGGDFQEQISPGRTSGSRSPSSGPSPRKLIVFHCEFSTERGPRLYRYLRELDRSLSVYPQLFYPELYILVGGYKEFSSQFPDLCDPSGYIPMLHRDFREQLRRFRRKRRSHAVRLRKKRGFFNLISDPPCQRCYK